MTDQTTTDLPATVLHVGDRVRIHTTTVRYHGRELWVNYETGTVIETWGADAHTAVVVIESTGLMPAVRSADLELL